MIIDLSLPIRNNTPEPGSPVVRYADHKSEARNLVKNALRLIQRKNLFFGILVKLKSVLMRLTGIDSSNDGKIPGFTERVFPGGMGLANEYVELDGHAGTHLDAPWHFGPGINGNKARTIDQVPLQWCFADGVVLDLRHKKTGEFINRKDIEGSLEKIGYDLKPNDIVLIMTGADKHFTEDNYFSVHPGMSAEATEFILDHDVKIIGIDAWGFDRPAARMLADYFRTRDSAFILPAHFVGRKREYCHIEKLANLDRIPRPFGFKVACFPVKIEGGSAGWCRTVAII